MTKSDYFSAVHWKNWSDCVFLLKVNVGEAETMMSVKCKFFFIELEFT